MEHVLSSKSLRLLRCSSSCGLSGSSAASVLRGANNRLRISISAAAQSPPPAPAAVPSSRDGRHVDQDPMTPQGPYLR